MNLNNMTHIIECAICLQPSVHPVQLPCSHIFCYLCVKGTAAHSNRCAMCRQDFPSEFLQNPRLIQTNISHMPSLEDGHQWFYEGRNGWWLYDERTSKEIELAFKRGESSCDLLIAGYVYNIDFTNMVQSRTIPPHRQRKIKRDLASAPIKGVAGLRMYKLKKSNECDRHVAEGENVNGQTVANSMLLSSCSPISHHLSNNVTNGSTCSSNSSALDSGIENISSSSAINCSQTCANSDSSFPEERLDNDSLLPLSRSEQNLTLSQPCDFSLSQNESASYSDSEV